MRKIEIDVETFSGADLNKCGVYKYAESPDFEILLFGYSVDGGEVQVVDLTNKEKIPKDIIEALTDESVEKWAHNVQFERVCLSRYLRDLGVLEGYLPPRNWRCSMIWSAYLGLPFSLAAVGAALGLEQQKMTEGKDLIRYFCVPCKPTKSNNQRTRNRAEDAKDKWEIFKEYNKRDVEVEMGICEKLSRFPVPEDIWKEFWLDQEINDRGILVDEVLVKRAIQLDNWSQERLKTAMQELTNLENPNSVAQMKQWLADNGLEMGGLGKKLVAEALKTAPEPLRTVLLLRQQSAKSAVKKYVAMDNAACDDGRCRGMFQFYGANRSGRFSGRIVQLQNLYRNSLVDLDEARELVRSGNKEALEMLYDSVPEVLAELVRTAFIPAPGKKFIVADFSAIEARVLSYMAGEQWRLDVFESGGDIYCATASRMFGVPVEKHGVNGELRQKGKQAELACIAEGQLVLTDAGLIPIERVTMEMRVWDGEEWVHHDGVVYRGEKEVITYEGLTATADHPVWIEGESWPVYFGVAAASGAHLAQTGDGENAIRLGKNHIRREKVAERQPVLCPNPVPRVWFNPVAESLESAIWKIERLSELFTAKTDSPMARKEIDSGKTAMREPKRQRVSQLWSKRHQICVSLCDSGRLVSDRKVRTSRTSNGNRPDRQQRELCAGQYSLCNTYAEQSKQTLHSPNGIFTRILALLPKCRGEKIISRVDAGRYYQGCRGCGVLQKEELATHQRTARLYDIRNAGPHHRFTVSGKLVHNCGYGGGVGAMKAMGAVDMGIPEEELDGIVQAWRNASPKIVKMWWDVDRAVKTAIKEKTTTATHNLKFAYQSGFLFITLPSGRQLAYVKPRMGENKFGGESVTYMGIGATKKWERIESYGPKFVENVIQGISRDVLLYAMENLREYRIEATVHDEVIVECDMDESVEGICNLMGRTPPWLPGICLRADGYECSFYKKD